MNKKVIYTTELQIDDISPDFAFCAKIDGTASKLSSLSFTEMHRNERSANFRYNFNQRKNHKRKQLI